MEDPDYFLCFWWHFLFRNRLIRFWKASFFWFYIVNATCYLYLSLVFQTVDLLVSNYFVYSTFTEVRSQNFLLTEQFSLLLGIIILIIQKFPTGLLTPLNLLSMKLFWRQSTYLQDRTLTICYSKYISIIVIAWSNTFLSRSTNNTLYFSWYIHNPWNQS